MCWATTLPAGLDTVILSRSAIDVRLRVLTVAAAAAAGIERRCWAPSSHFIVLFVADVLVSPCRVGSA